MNVAVSRVAMAFALVTAVVVAVVVGSAVIAHESAERRARLLVAYADDLTTASRSEVAAEAMIAAGRGYLLTREPALLERVRTGEADLDAALRALEPRAASPFERDLLAEVRSSAARYLELIERSFSDPTIGSDQRVVAELFTSRLLPARADLEARTRKLVAEKVRLQSEGRAALHQTARRAFGAVVALGGVGTLLAVTLAWIFTRRLDQLYLSERAAAMRERRAANATRDLVAAVAHDLRNPLGAIVMNVAQLMAETSDAKARKRAGAVDRIAHRMERFIGDLLDAATIEAGVFSVAKKKCSVVELVGQVVDDFREEAAEKQIALRWQIDEAPFLWADPIRLSQVLANLVGNAIKFTPSRGVVEVRVAATGALARFEVRDTGPGIAGADLLHLFDRYWKGRSTGQRGVGLGLYIAKGIVEGHGGEMSVHSVLGRGSSFVFTIPARTARPSPAGEPSPPPSPAAPAAAPVQQRAEPSWRC